MLDHLLTFDPEPLDIAASSFVPDEKATAAQTLSGKATTEEWLRAIGAEQEVSIDPALERALAAQAFGAVTGATVGAAHDPLMGSPEFVGEQTKKHVMALTTPESVRNAVNMLTAYEWSFVEKAQEIRSYIVTSLIEESKHTKPEIRLKALKLLGDVTEVGLFTQRTEIVTKNLSDAQVEEEIKKRLDKYIVNPDTPLVTRIDTDVDDT